MQTLRYPTGETWYNSSCFWVCIENIVIYSIWVFFLIDENQTQWRTIVGGKGMERHCWKQQFKNAEPEMCTVYRFMLIPWGLLLWFSTRNLVSKSITWSKVTIPLIEMPIECTWILMLISGIEFKTWSKVLR